MQCKVFNKSYKILRKEEKNDYSEYSQIWCLKNADRFAFVLFTRISLFLRVAGITKGRKNCNVSICLSICLSSYLSIWYLSIAVNQERIIVRIFVQGGGLSARGGLKPPENQFIYFTMVQGGLQPNPPPTYAPELFILLLLYNKTRHS